MKNIKLYDVRTIKTLKDMLEQSASIYGEKSVFLSKSQEGANYSPISFIKFKKDVDAFGTALLDLGLKGKRVTVIGENRYEWSTTFLATVNGTGVIVPLDRELPVNEIQNLILRSKASAIVFAPSVRGKIDSLIGDDRFSFVEYFIDMESIDDNGKLISFNNLMKKGHKLLDDGNTTYTDVIIDETVMCNLLFTSGTTEQSKAVMLSHKNICSDLVAMCSMLYIDETDIFLSVLPIHHTYESTCGFLCQVYRGSTIAYCEGLRHIPKNLIESKSTIILGVPLIFEAMYKRIWDQAAKLPKGTKKLKLGIKISNFLKLFGIDITKKIFAPIHDAFGGNLRLFISGAAAMDPTTAKGFRDIGINIVQGYGLTECSPIVALNRSCDYKDDSVGLPLSCLELKIDNPNQEGIGEIVVKGPNVMLGYYENDEATAKVLKDGWFYTGDLAYIDSDGFVRITGRKKNVIITKNGKNIYPEEIEILLNRSKYIKETLVFGIAKSDDIEVTATIVPDIEVINEQFKDTTVSAETIFDLINEDVKSVNKSLIAYKHIKNFTLRDNEFVKTTTKKIKRFVEDNKTNQ